MPFSPCRTAEAEVGMLYYLSSAEGTGGRLKETAEDFIVDEISSRPPAFPDGKFTIATVQARNWETNRMVRLLARQLNMSRDRIGFAGTKDKRAVTTQLMSFMCPPDRLSQVDLQDLTISDPYTARRGMAIGDLIGNRFGIRVTKVGKSASEVSDITADVMADIKASGGFPNYFGVQRFGAVRPITHKVGELIVRGDIEGAVRCYVCDPPRYSEEKETEADKMRKLLASTDDWSQYAKNMPDFMGFEAAMVAYISNNPGDWEGAVKELPTNLQMMFVHAYQSYLFNLMLSERISRGIPLNHPVTGDVVVPVDADGNPKHEEPVLVTAKNIDLVERQIKLGRAYVTHVLFGGDGIMAEGEPGEIEHGIIEKTGLSAEDFIIPELPHCSSTGSRRELICPVNDLAAEIGEGSYRLTFSLPKGNYATCLLREFMKSEMTDY